MLNSPWKSGLIEISHAGHLKTLNALENHRGGSVSEHDLGRLYGLK